MPILPIVIFDFDLKSDLQNWRIVNDSVMGGTSKSIFYLNSEGEGNFEGTVSLANNGGFCAVKYVFEKVSLSRTSQFSIRIKGDGKTYQFRVKSNNNDSHSYVFAFKTDSSWQNIEILFAELKPAFRGRQLELPPFDGEAVAEITFLIGNKIEESFLLQIDCITVS